MAKLPPEGAPTPGHIAETYWRLHNQPCDASSLEVDLRSRAEKFQA